jgi:hypothetical protein
MKKNKKSEFLEQLKKIPIVLVACEKSGISRNTVYRWRKEDEQFSKDMEAALKEGEELVNDMSESQLLTMIKEKNWAAISFWLRHHHSTYRNRVEVTTVAPQEELTPEQEETVRDALRLASVDLINNSTLKKEIYGTESTSTKPHGNDAQGSESANSNN